MKMQEELQLKYIILLISPKVQRMFPITKKEVEKRRIFPLSCDSDISEIPNNFAVIIFF